MAKDIKGITIKIGGDADGFKKALKEMNSATQAVQTELNAVNKSLKFDPKNTDLLKQKEELLAKQLEDVRIKVDKLKAAKEQADKEMADGTEVNQEKYRQLVREISVAEGQLKSLIKQNDKFGNSARELGGKIEGIGKKGMAVSGAIVGIGAAAVSMGIKAAQSADDINTLSKQTGLSTEQIQKFQYASERIDVPLETLTGSMAKLTRNMQSAKNGSKNTQLAFDELGISITDNEGKLRSNQDVFNEAIDALAKMENETQRDAIAMQIFGKSAQDLNPLILGGSEALRQYSEEAENAGLILNQDTLDAANELNDAVDKLKATATGAFAKVGSEIATKLTPMIEPASDALIKVVDVVSDLDAGQVKLIAGIGVGLATIPPLLIGTGKMITAIGTISTAYKTMAASATAASVATKAIPFIGVAATAITLIGAVAALTSATDEETKKTKELHEASVKRYEDYQKNKQAAQEQAEASLSEISHIESLKDELIELADENGRVTDGDKARAEFILGQLNSALGTEYTMTGNIIRNYQNLSAEIDNLIIKKKAEILLSSMEGSYKNAIKEKEKEASILRERTEAYEQALKAYEDYQKKVDEAAKQGLYYEMQQGQKLTELKDAIEQAKEAMEESSDAMGKYESDIKAYESAYASITEDGGKAFVASWKDRTTVLTEEQKKAGKAYEDAVVKLADYTEKYKQGVEGYTEAGRKELEDHVAELKTEAEKIGVSINEGMVVGLEDTEEVKSAVSTLCDLIPQWAKDFLGINSPAKVAIPIGEAIPEGIGVGITKDMSAEEALEKKCKNLQDILKDYTEVFDLNIKLAESEHNLFLAQNPEASPIQKLAKQEEMLNKQYAEQEGKVQAVNDALWHQIQLTGEESVESKKLLIQLNEEKKAYMELADAIEEVNKEKASYSGGGSSYVAGGSPESKYAAYHVQYGAMLKSQGVSQEAIDAAARKVSGYTGERSINITNHISGVTPDTAYKVSQETAKTMNNLAMQGVS